MASIFSRIIAGEIPCHRVYESALVIAFLDIAPLSPGHTLVVPKRECEFLHQLDDASAAALGEALPRVARAVLAATGATAYNILQNNGAAAHQAVPHVHFHIIPKPNPELGLGVGWKPGTLAAPDGTALAERIRASL